MSHMNIKSPLFASLLAFSGLLGACGGEATTQTEIRRITAADVAALGPNESLTVDASSENVLTVFEQGGGDIDYNRIQLICPNGQIMPMDQWIARQIEVFGTEFFSGDRIVVAADPFRFGLDKAAVDTLRTERVYRRSQTQSFSGDDGVARSGRGLTEEGENMLYHCCTDGLYICQDMDELEAIGGE